MSESESINAMPLLPPEVLDSPPAEARCPHCGKLLAMELPEIWAHATKHYYRLNSARNRQDALESWKQRMPCAWCGEQIDATLTPTVTYHLTLTAPDPLEKYPPNSRYWEAQKRGLPTSTNLKFDPPGGTHETE